MSAEPLIALDRTIEAATRLTELMENDLQRRGLNVAQAGVLFHLREQGPMVQRQLSEALAHTPRHVTSLVDALEQAGLVRRQEHPDDRRAWLVRLTDHGLQLVETMDRDRREAARQLFSDLPPSEIASYVAVLNHVLDRLPHTTATAGGHHQP